jgi:hypothetical protein
MRGLLEARSASVPAVLTPAQQRNLDSPFRLLLQHGWRWDWLDADLLEAMAAVLGASFPLPTTPKGPDLELWDPLERFYPEVMDLEDLPRRGTYRSPWPVLTFCLVADGTADILLELTARLPEGNGEVQIAANGTGVGTFPVGPRWSKGIVRVPAAALHPGLNRLTLRWPDPPPVDGDPFQPVIERLDLGLEADLTPSSGRSSPSSGYPPKNFFDFFRIWCQKKGPSGNCIDEEATKPPSTRIQERLFSSGRSSFFLPSTSPEDISARMARICPACPSA